MASGILITSGGCKQSDEQTSSEQTTPEQVTAEQTTAEQTEIDQETIYNEVVSAINGKNYDIALEKIETILGYKDTDLLLNDIYYKMGMELVDNNDFEMGIAVLNNITGKYNMDAVLGTVTDKRIVYLMDNEEYAEAFRYLTFPSEKLNECVDKGYDQIVNYIHERMEVKGEDNEGSKYAYKLYQRKPTDEIRELYLKCSYEKIYEKWYDPDTLEFVCTIAPGEDGGKVVTANSNCKFLNEGTYHAKLIDEHENVMDSGTTRVYSLAIDDQVFIDISHTYGTSLSLWRTDVKSNDFTGKLLHDGDLYGIQFMKEHPELTVPVVPETKPVKIQRRDPAIGMSASAVEESTWGKPDHINKTTYAWGTTEQWCYYGYKYIYFTNGKVVAISE